MGAGGAGGGSEGCRGYVAAWGKSSPLRQEAKAVSGRPPPTQRVVSDLFLPLATVPEPRRQLQAQPRWRSAHPVHGDWDLARWPSRDPQGLTLNVPGNSPLPGSPSTQIKLPKLAFSQERAGAEQQDADSSPPPPAATSHWVKQ